MIAYTKEIVIIIIFHIILKVDFEFIKISMFCDKLKELNQKSTVADLICNFLEETLELSSDCPCIFLPFIHLFFYLSGINVVMTST